MEAPQPAENPSPLPFPVSPFLIFVLLLLAMFLGNLLASGLILGIAQWTGQAWDQVLRLGPDSTLGRRQGVRSLHLLSHLFTFAIPSLTVAWFVFRRQWSARTGLRQWPDGQTLLLACLFIGAAFAPAQLLYEWNRALPLPDWMSQLEGQAEEMIRRLLTMERPDEWLMNVLVIGLVPAIGEELLFRGLIQRQIEGYTHRPHLAVWTAAILFSAIHLQFEGFLPRMFLGLALGYLFLWTRSLWVPIAAHFFNNAGQVSLQYFWDPGTEESLNDPDMDLAWYTIALSLILLFGIGYILYLRHSARSEAEALSMTQDEE